ncbi:MAG: ATP-binding protein [Planctomycetota bacterium]
MNPSLKDGPALDDAMAAFAGISESLVKSYQALSDRAQMVEDELGRTNLELEHKVRELDEVNRHLEAVLRSLPTGVVVRDADGRIARINESALAILGTGEAATRFFEGAGGAAEALHDQTGPTGRRMVIAARRSAVCDAGGSPVGSVEILDDRTELASMSERMHTLDKMAALGTMGGGIAHEIRNPLNAVKGFASLLERRLADDDAQARRWASRIVEGAAEADAIIESLLAFASPERVKLDPIDPEALVADAVRAALGPDTEVEVSTECDAPEFAADRIKLRQALRNLIANASEAQGGCGTVHIKLTREGDSIVARVRDKGPGIPSELRARVLDPFFTTRPEGTGLGLALVATIARLHAGSIDIGAAPAPLGGAEISIQIPYQLPPTAQPHEKAN